jgi:hypothetical protein
VVGLGVLIWVLWQRDHREEVVETEARVVEKFGAAQHKMVDVVEHAAEKVVEKVKHKPHERDSKGKSDRDDMHSISK